MPNFEAIRTEDNITALILNDPWRVAVLNAAQTLQLPDWWIGAGFLRNLIWDVLEGNDALPTRDVDLVYFDATNVEPETDWAYDKQQQAHLPFAQWEIRNQARMHYVNSFAPYATTEDGISHWVETATCIAVKLEGEKLKYLFCHGTNDLFGLIARPIPAFTTEELLPVFRSRIQKKRWLERWPHLQVLDR